MTPERHTKPAHPAAIALAALATWLAGCSEPVCGPPIDPALPGVTASNGTGTVTYGGFTSSSNHDCTPPGNGPVSITLDGIQQNPAPAMPMHLTFCLPRPHQLGNSPVPLTDTDRIQLIDVYAEISGCIIALDRATPPNGTFDVQGYCDSGVHPDGYALVLDATVAATNTCTGEATTLTLTGSAPAEALVF